MLIDLLRIENRLSEWRELIGKQEENVTRHGNHAWVANLNPPFPSSYIGAVRSFLLNYYVKPTEEKGFARWGFKEVRYRAPEAKLLFECFPNCRIIFLLRHPRGVLASNASTVWYGESGSAAGVMNSWISNVRSMMELEDERILSIRYEDLLSTPQLVVNAIEEHIGLGSSSIDLSILQQKVRGGQPPPRLGADETAALDTRELYELMAKIGYD